MIDWEENDRFSFEDSERFEEDSLCSWISEPESLCNNFRGWKKQTNYFSSRVNKDGQPLSLVELSARVVALHIPFEVVEKVFPPIPEQLQLRIAYWSFPDNEEDLRLYSCLATGSAEEFQKGEALYKMRAVKDPLQIGFHLSASVCAGGQGSSTSSKGNTFNVAVTFDRCHVTSCTCTCSSPASWCCHVVAVCLNRMYQPNQVRLRAPVSETLSRLQRVQLQKFAQYLISELPQQILPTAQRLLDDLLSNQQIAINTIGGAPDPTAGGNVHDHTLWCLDESVLHENIRKILMKLCMPSPMVFSDVNYLSSTAPPAASEWSNLLRPLRGREPEGIWNLLSIVREMFRRNDRNAISLLDILTEEILSCDQILVWWFNTKVSLGSGTGRGGGGNASGNSHASQHSCSGLCEELVVLWRLAALDPSLSPKDRHILFNQLYGWHTKTLERIWKTKVGVGVKRADLEAFSGLRPALEACLLDWADYPISRVTFENGGQLWYSPYLHSKTFDQWNAELGKQNRLFHNCNKLCCSSSNSSTAAAINSNRSSSVSSEGFSEPEAAISNSASPPKPSSLSNEEEVLPLSEKIYVATSAPPSGNQGRSEGKEEEERFVITMKKMEDPFEILFARAEALHAHGHLDEACKLAVQLAEHLLTNPPDLSLAPTTNSATGSTSASGSSRSWGKRGGVKGARHFNPHCHQVSLLASATLAKASFLCTVLSENQTYTNLAFRVGLYGLEMARPPASTKPLEVKLANQEQDLGALLKHLPLGDAELAILRDRAILLREGTHTSRGEALLPLTLASYIFEALVLSGQRSSQDEQLGFEAALAALGLKANVCEADHPLLCEGTRRQRGDLAISMLVHYKDNPEKLAKVMDKLLDKEVHQMYKQSHQPSPQSSLYYTESPLLIEPSGAGSGEGSQGHEGNGSTSDKSPWADEDPICEEDWEAKLRCTNFKTNKRHSKGMASIDSSAPETTSSDNSPTLVRRATNSWMKHESGSDSGSSGDSSDSLGSSSSDDKASKSRENDTNGNPRLAGDSRIIATCPKLYYGRSGYTTTAGGSNKGRSNGGRTYPNVPNQPSEASAHFMLELAKTVLNKAGGSSSTAVLFTQPPPPGAPGAQPPRGPHRALHMAAFQIGLYALGLHNAVSPNWLSRTYSSHVSWITGQAMEIGTPALHFLMETWEGHLTPPEVVSLADRASRGRDPSLVRAAADLALSCLPHAQALNPNEIQRALIQCKEQSSDLLERACLAVESAAKGGGVYPEVLFEVAKKWYELYSEGLSPNEEGSNTSSSSGSSTIGNEPPTPPPPPPPQQPPMVMENVITTVQIACPPPTVSYALAYPTYGPYLAYVPTAYPYGTLTAYYPPSPAAAHLRHHPPAIYPVTTRPPPSLSISNTTGTLTHVNQQRMNYILSAYRVGMLAMDTLARRVHDDRPQAKYARNPTYGEDVKWLLSIAKKLGPSYLQDFCVCTVNSVASPFILHELVLDAAHYLAGQPLRSHFLTPLIQKCQQMFIACAHFKMYHITSAEYDEFVNIIRTARSAFQLTPGGHVQFNEFLQSIRRSKSCKKDLWQRIASSLATPAI